MADVTEKVIFELVGTDAFKTVADDIGKISAAINTARDDLKGLSGAISGFEGGSINVPTVHIGTSQIDTGGLGGVAPGARAASQALGEMNYEAGRTSQAMNEVNYSTGMTVTQFRDMDTTVGEAGNSLANQRYALYDAADAYGYLATMATAAYASTAGVAILFEDQFSQVHRTAGLVGDEVGAMKEELIDLTREIPTSFGNLADVAAIGGQLGIAKDDIVDFTRVVTMMATTTDVSLEESALLFGRFQTLLGTTADEFEALGSAILEVGVDSAAGEVEIAKMSIELAAVASQAGLTEVQLIALTGTLASAGIPAERGRSAVQNSFDLMDRAIRDNGEELQKWAALAGVSADEFAASWGTTDFFGMFKRSIEGLAQAGSGAGAVLDDLGVRNARTRTGLQSLASAVDLLDKSIDLSSDGWSQAAALQDHFGISADTVASRLVILKNEVMALMDQLGRGFIDTGLFTGAITVLSNALWVVTEIIERVPLASWFSTAASAGLLVVAAMSTFRRITAIVTANSFALADSQKAMSKGFGGTKEATQSLLSSLFSMNTAQKEAVIAEKVAVTSKELLMAATLQQRVATQLATAEQQRYNAVILGNDAAFQKASAAIAMHEKNLVTANAAVDAAKIKNDQLNASLVAQATAATTASTAQTTAATSTSWFATKLTGLKDGIFAVGKSLLRMAPQFLIFTGASVAIDAIISTIRRVATSAEEGARQIEGLTDAIAQDTRAVENGEDAYLQMAVAMDDMGNVSHSVVARLDDGTDAMDLQAQAINSLKATSDQDPLATLGAGQKNLKSDIDESTEAIKVQMFYMGQASMMKMWDSMEGSSFKELIGELQQLADLGNVEAGNAVHNLMTQFSTGTLASEDFASAINLLTNATQETNDHLLTTGGSARISAEDLDGYREVAAEILGLDPSQFEKYLELFEGASEEFEKGSDLAGVFNEQLNEQGAAAAFAAYTGLDPLNAGLSDYNEGVDEAVDSSYDLVGSQMAMADAMYAFGESLFENGNNFDIFTQAGRENMAALDKSIETAVANANGDATVLAQNMAAINQALVNNGVMAINALQTVIERYQALASGDTSGSFLSAASLSIALSLQQTTPAISRFGRALDEGYTDAFNRAARAGGGGGKKVADGAKNLGKEAKKAAEEVRTLADYVSDLSKVMNRSFDFRWGHMQQLDDTADAWQSIKDWAEDAAQAIKDARDEIRDAKDAIRDIKNEIKGIDADLAELKAQENVLEFQLKVAIDYGDELRAKQIEAELLGNRAEQSEVSAKRDDAKRDLGEGERDLTDATKKLSDAQRDAQRDLTGTTESARDQRDMVWDLLESYQKQIQTYADTGASAQDLEQYSRRLRSEFEDQLKQLGYNKTEVKNFSTTFDDLTTVIKKVPRNVTVAVDPNPALRALEEFRAGLGKTNTSIDNTRGKARDLNTALGGINNSVKTNKSRDELQKLINRFKPLIDRVKEFYDQFFKKAPKHAGVGGSVGSALARGGVASVFNFAKGGLVPDVSGHFGFKPQGTDTVPAMLTPGEYVIPRNVVSAIGTPFFDALRNNRGAVPVTGNTYIHQSGAPNVQLVELMPHQFNSMVSAVSRNVGRAIASGADLSVATTRANNRAVRAGAN